MGLVWFHGHIGRIRFGELWFKEEGKKVDSLGGPDRVGQASKNPGQIGGTSGSFTKMAA